MCRVCRERFPRHLLQRKPLVSDPGMHHGTCVTHVLWCMSGSLTCGGEENVPGISGACATRTFAYLASDSLRPWTGIQCTVCPMKYAYGFVVPCLVMDIWILNELMCDLIFFSVASLALRHHFGNDEITMNDTGKIDLYYTIIQHIFWTVYIV